MLDLTLFLVVVRLVIPLAYELGKDYGMKWIEKHFDDDEDQRHFSRIKKAPCPPRLRVLFAIMLMTFFLLKTLQHLTFKKATSMTDVKDRGALPDIVDFQELSAFIDNKKRA